jgi:hypothetical protein
MVIFNSYVKFPEGNHWKWWCSTWFNYDVAKRWIHWIILPEDSWCLWVKTVKHRKNPSFNHHVWWWHRNLTRINYKKLHTTSWCTPKIPWRMLLISPLIGKLWNLCVAEAKRFSLVKPACLMLRKRHVAMVQLFNQPFWWLNNQSLPSRQIVSHMIITPK